MFNFRKSKNTNNRNIISNTNSHEKNSTKYGNKKNKTIIIFFNIKNINNNDNKIRISRNKIVFSEKLLILLLLERLLRVMLLSKTSSAS